MKKYTLVLFVLLFSFGLFNINLNSAEAVSQSPYPAGCRSTAGYSPLTGVKCDSYVNTSLPAGCTSTLGYSPLTGVKCDSQTSNPALPVGCTSTVGYSPTTGVKCDSGAISIPVYPPGCTSNSGYSVTTGQSCGGGYSPVPTISGVSGPQTLNVSQQGTWTVTAYDKSGGNLSYHADWGEGNDNPYGLSTNSSTQQSATFTHVYSTAGIRTVTFEVTNNSGQSTQTSLSVSVGEVVSTGPLKISWSGGKDKVNIGLIDDRFEKDGTVLGWIMLNTNSYGSLDWYRENVTDLTGTVTWSVSSLSKGPFRIVGNTADQNGNYCLRSINPNECRVVLSGRFDIKSSKNIVLSPFPTNSSTSSITVLSPNGGETWTLGTTQTISWKDSNNISSHEIKLVSSGWSSTIANTQGSSFNWLVGKMLDNSTFPVSNPPSAIYTIQVCQTGTTICGSSSAPFTITSGTTTSTTITSISPTSAKVGDTVTIYGLNFDTVAPFIYLTNGYLAKVLTPITSSSTQISFSVPSDLSVGTYTVQAISRANSTSSDNSVYFTVVAATTSSLSITTPSLLPYAKVGQAYSVTINASGGSGSYSWSVNNGAAGFPIAGLGISSSYGNPIYIIGTSDKVYNNGVESTVAEPFTFNVTVTSGSQSVSKQFTLTVNPADVAHAYTPTISSVLADGCSYVSGVNTINGDGCGYARIGATVYVNGSGFNQNISIVTYKTLNGTLTSLGTTFISSTRLSFIVPSPTSDDGSGTHLIKVQQNTDTSILSNAIGINFAGPSAGQVQGATAFHFTLLLQLGSSGNEVLELQKFLNVAGYDTGVADGNFGAKTEAAVIKLQTANGLAGDGIVGALTRDVLNR